MRRCLPLVLALVVLATACSSNGGEPTAAPSDSETPPAAAPTETAQPEPANGAATTDAIGIAVQPHPTNALIALVTVAGNGPVDLEIRADGVPARTMTSTAAGERHELVVVGLRAETDYVFSATTPAGSATQRWMTGPLPSNAPVVEIAQRSTDPATNGMTFVGLRDTAEEDPAYFAFDADGHVVWYLHADQRLGGDPYVRHVGGDEVLAVFQGRIQRLRLDGTIVHEFDLAGVSGWHHDMRVLDNGSLLLLTRETRTIDGREITGDVIVELNTDLAVAWQWSTFDHLDTQRFPGPLATTESRSGGLDWTHGNALWVEEASGEILISLRSQGWVVSVNRATGDINWIAGDDTDTAADFDAPFLTLQTGTWFTGQHAAMRTASGELLVYDNRNESGGPDDESRAVIYSIDPQAGTARQVFEAGAGKYTSSLGDVDELANGNVLMTAGGPGNRNRDARIVEVDRSGEVLSEAVLPGTTIYRSERVPWNALGSAASGTASTGSPAATASPATAEELGQGTNITNAELTSTQHRCDAYVGSSTSAVTDVSSNRAFMGEATVSVDGDWCVIESNSIPNHDMGEGSSFANDVAEVLATYRIPNAPQIANSSTPIGTDPAAVVLLNGVAWEAYPAACFGQGRQGSLGRERIGCPGRIDHPWRYNIGSPLNRFGLDTYFAHPQGDGYYHYHRTPVTLYDQGCAGVAASPVIGFARDGFPVFGPCFMDESGEVRPAKSSYALRRGERADVDGFETPYLVGEVASLQYDGQFMGDYEYIEQSGDLDECNGMIVDGMYGYFLTEDYPFVIGCYRGTPASSDDFGRTTPR